MKPIVPVVPPIRAGRRAQFLALGLLGATVLGAILLACEPECFSPNGIGAIGNASFLLDAAHPVALTHVAVSLSAEALPADLATGAATLTTTLKGPDDVSVTFIPDSSGRPAGLVSGHGVIHLSLDACERGRACQLTFTAVAEWTAPRAGASTSAELTIDVGIRFPFMHGRCGPPAGATATVGTTPPESRSSLLQARLASRAGPIGELVQHVTVRLDDPAALIDPLAERSVVARGRLAVAPGETGAITGSAPVPITGLWIRVTPDDATEPLVDAPVTVAYPTSLPADAVFPILDRCHSDDPCAEGYWIQMLVYDPGGHTPASVPFAPFDWQLEVGISAPEGRSLPTSGLSVVADAGRAIAPTPPSLVNTGQGGSFHVEDNHPATTLAITATIPERSTRPVFGDARADATILFLVSTTADPGSRGGHLYLSTGHYVGDGSTADDAADTGGWGAPVGGGVDPYPYPVGRPLSACSGVDSPCTSRTGLVIRRYSSVFERDSPTSFGASWQWRVVGAPPGTQLTVTAVDGEALDAGSGPPIPAPVVLAALFVAIVVATLVLRPRLRRARSRDVR
jgi:hypothetical protein